MKMKKGLSHINSPCSSYIYVTYLTQLAFTINLVITCFIKLKNLNIQVMKKTLLVSIGILSFLLLTTSAYSQSMTIAPSKIILNASGITLEVKCLWSGSMLSGSVISDQDIQIYVSGNYITDAYSLTYCWIDQMFKATFDRYDFLTNTYIQSIANDGDVRVTISGNYTITDSSGTDHVIVLPIKLDYAEFVRPTGSKKKH